MPRPTSGRAQFADLRQRAEQFAAQSRHDVPASGTVDALLHELLVYQTELEMQNEELRATQTDLADARDRYRALFEFTPVGLLTLAADGRIVDANLMAAAVLGLQRDGLLKKRLKRLVAVEDLPKFERCRQAVLDQRQRQTCEVRMRRPDGTLLFVRADFAVPAEDNIDIDVPAMVCYAALTDITASKADQAALSASEQRYRGLYDSSHDGIAHVTMDGRFIDANPAMLDMLGYTLDELRQLTFRDVTPTRWDELEEQIVRTQIMARGYSDEYAKEYIRKTGEVFPISIRVWLLRDESGRESGMWAVVRDVSERRRAERAVQSAQRSLQCFQRKERKRIEAELERVRHELVRSTKLAAVGQLSAQVAHEIRNPLGAVRNAAYYLKHRAPAADAKWAEYLQLIEHEIGICERIIGNLLEITRHRQPVRETVDVAGLARQAVARLEAPLRVQVRVACRPEPFLVDADPVQLRQVFDNLLKNALEALDLTDGQGGGILLSAHRTESFDEIYVADTGCGVGAGDRDNLFELFYSTKAKGTGLGLAICRQIVELHDGTIELLTPEETELELGPATAIGSAGGTFAPRFGAAFRIRLPRVPLDG